VGTPEDLAGLGSISYTGAFLARVLGGATTAAPV